MTKMTWTRPMTEVQQFAANEYVAACAEVPTAYKFVCNAPAGNLFYTNEHGFTIQAGYVTGSYAPCAKTHPADMEDMFYEGFVDYNGNAKKDAGEEVIVWLEETPHLGINYNWHATTELDIASWEVTKS